MSTTSHTTSIDHAAQHGDANRARSTVTGRSVRRIVGAGAVAAALALAGCSSDGGSSNLNYGAADEPQADVGGAQPEADGGFTSGGASEVPTPNAGVPSQDAVVESGTTTQSFTVEGADAEQAINDYVAQAAESGWEPTGDPVKTGADVWQTEMVNSGTTMTITAGPADGQTADGQDRIELSVQTTGS